MADYGDALAGMSRSGNVLQSLGYDPEDLKADPALRAQVMQSLTAPMQVAQNATPPNPRTMTGAPANPNPMSPNGNSLVPAPGQPRLFNRVQPTAPVAPPPASLAPPSVTPKSMATGVSPSVAPATANSPDITNARQAAGNLLAPEPALPDTTADDTTIAAKSAPINPDQKQYKESFWGNVGRGLNDFREGFAGHPEKVVDYSAPNEQYRQDDATRQAQLGRAQTDRTNILERFKQMSDQRKQQDTASKDAGEISNNTADVPIKQQNADSDTSRAATEKQVADQNSPAGKVATTDAQFDEATKKADQLGLKGTNRTLFLANGKIPDPRQATEDEIATHQAMQVFQRENGHAPQTLEDYRQIRQAAKGEKDQGTQMLVPDGKGGMTTKLIQPGDSVPAGSTSISGKPAITTPGGLQPTVADRNRASLAHVASDNLDQIQDVVTRRPDLLGMIGGRISNVDQMIGSNDPDLQVLGNAAHNFAMANAGIHGSRSFENVKAAEQELLNGLKTGPKGVGGAIKSNRDNLTSIIERVEGKKAATGATGTFNWDAHPVVKP